MYECAANLGRESVLGVRVFIGGKKEMRERYKAIDLFRRGGERCKE